MDYSQTKTDPSDKDLIGGKLGCVLGRRKRQGIKTQKTFYRMVILHEVIDLSINGTDRVPCPPPSSCWPMARKEWRLVYSS